MKNTKDVPPACLARLSSSWGRKWLVPGQMFRSTWTILSQLENERVKIWIQEQKRRCSCICQPDSFGNFKLASPPIFVSMINNFNDIVFFKCQLSCFGKFGWLEHGYSIVRKVQWSLRWSTVPTTIHCCQVSCHQKAARIHSACPA